MNKTRWLIGIGFALFIFSTPFLVLKNERDYSHAAIAHSAKKVTNKSDIAQVAFNSIPNSLDPYFDLSLAINIILMEEKDFPTKYSQSNVARIREIASRCVNYQNNIILNWAVNLYSLRIMSPDLGLDMACDGLSKFQARQMYEFDDHRNSERKSNPYYMSDPLSEYVVFLSFFDEAADFP